MSPDGPPVARPALPVRALVLLALGLALAVVAVQLAARPIAWDELEYVRATRWVAAGRVPYRDFWEHHPPLLWYLGAPFAWLLGAPGAGGYVRMRVVAAVLAACGLALAARLVRRAGAPRDAVVVAGGLLLGCTTFSGTLVEYRVDGAMTALVICALAAAESAVADPRRARRGFLLAGALLAFAGLASQRALPVAAGVAAVYLVAGRNGRWSLDARALWIPVGALGPIAAALGALAAAHALGPFWHDAFALSLRYDAALRAGGAASAGSYLVHTAAGRGDYASFALALGFALSLATLLGRAARPALDVRIALLALGQIAALGVAHVPPYAYHFQLSYVLAAMLVALAAGRWTSTVATRARRARRAIPAGALVVIALTAAGAARLPVRAMGAVRGYQDHVLERIDAITLEGDRVWDASGYAPRREPAFEYWMLPHLVAVLTRAGVIPAFDPARVAAARPAALVVDARLARYVREVPGLEVFLGRNYLPLEPAVWLAAPNARLAPGEDARFRVLRAGRHRVVRAPALLGSPWFVAPVAFALIHDVRPDRYRFDTAALAPAGPETFAVSVDGVAIALPATLDLPAGALLEVRNRAAGLEVVLVLPIDHAVYFEIPYPRTALDPMRFL